jgi:membrane protease subunit HflC
MSKIISIIVLVAVLIIGFQSAYILEQTKQSVELRFGKAVDQETTPGLKFKMPFVDEVRFFDKRLLDLNAEPKEVIASDKKRMIVDSFAKYKIFDALKFYQTVRNERSGNNKLDSILESSMRQVIGENPLNALLTAGVRSNIMDQIKDILNKESQSFGIEVVDVRIMRADLPGENSEAIYRRMQTEREREAKEFRAEGNEEAKKITSKAEREKVEILAQAKKKSEIIRGKADAIATKTFAQSFGRDPAFYDFYKSLEVYKNAFAKDSTRILLSPEGKFFKHFNR